MNDLAHINPNCINARFCKQHGEQGPVDHDFPALFEDIRQQERTRLASLVEKMLKTHEGDKDRKIFLNGYNTALMEVLKALSAKGEGK